jgi:hypothetical protein
MLLLRDGILEALAVTLRPINVPIRGVPARIAFRCHVENSSDELQNGQ